MAETIRSGTDVGSNGRGTDARPGGSTHATAGPAASSVVSAVLDRAAGSKAPPVEHASSSAGARPIARARQLVEQLTALPRLARHANARAESAAERIARRRRIAQATLDEEAGSRGETDWARVGVFGAGVAIGALIGAGAALLLAPATGYETRTRLARRTRDVADDAADRWDDVSDELRYRARHGAKRVRQRVRRAATSSRWAVEDAWDRRRRD